MDNTMTSQTAGGGRRQMTALFDSRADADEAARRIEGLGIAPSDIRIVDGAQGESVEPHEEKSFMEQLGDFFGGDDDRATYSEGLRRGGYMLSVTTDAAHRDQVIDILDDEGTVDLDAREADWRAEGWTGYDESAAMGGAGVTDRQPAPGMAGGPSATAYEPAPGMAEAPADFSGRETVDGTIEIAEEKLRIGKRETDHGRVRVRSYVVEDQVEEDVTLRDEHVSISRTAVDRPLEGDAAFEERTLTAEEHGEEAVVSKEARVTEEIKLEKDVEDHTETVRDTVRHTEVEIDDDRK